MVDLFLHIEEVFVLTPYDGGSHVYGRGNSMRVMDLPFCFLTYVGVFVYVSLKCNT